MSTRQTNQRRKKEHLHIALNADVSSGLSTGLEDYRFIHRALPEIDLADVDTSARLFGRRLNAPIVISPMVGGIDEATVINRNLAQAAQELGLAMGVGSQRCSIDERETCRTYRVRDLAPDILLFANLGAVQLKYGYTIVQCQQAVDMIGADALVLHINPLQEALQRDGNTAFGGLLAKIEQVCRALSVPVIVKEVGFGISEDVATKLVEAGVAGIDVAGAGGTSFSRVESLRDERVSGAASDGFSSWGIPTAESLRMVRRAAPVLPVIASGGIRTGVDVAKAIAIGADAAGIATPLLKAASVSAEEVLSLLRSIVNELRISMFCVGAASIGTLRDSPFLVRK
ncbi:MAG: type 2 isopentenyl-diphosphate Delta-isomerase [Chloroflexi bacterium RBG_16_57_8]|nr:MAG: type 2 isopentenyl-diphosphate Delta-isomerase [Chloroflexi bacterium RBG_16_57_8]